MRSLFTGIIYLGLILSAHFGLLSLAFGQDWIKLFYFEYRTPLLLSALVIAGVYIILSVLLKTPGGKREKAVLGVALVAAGFGFLLYSVLFSAPELQRLVASAVLFLGVACLAAFAASKRENAGWRNLGRLLGAGLLFSALVLAYPHQKLIFQPENPLAVSTGKHEFKAEKKLIHTAFYPVDLTRYYMLDYYLPAKISNIPSYISALDNKNFLLIDRYGNMYHLRLKQSTEDDSSEENLYIRKLSAVFPINYRELHASKTGKRITKSFFRVNDVYTDVEGGERALYVSHHFYDAEKKCFTLRITKLAGDVSVLLENKPAPGWKTLYETAPCFKAAESRLTFLGNQAGGRIVGLDEDHLLFSVGDHGFDTHIFGENFPQDPNVSYGKIWKINRRSGKADLVSLGHRNPQGLYRAADGSVWETEHGPAGGDELNKIKAGRNYGWPHVLYGATYGRYIWPPGIEQDGHAHYEQPVYAWTPAIAVSNLIRVEQDLFPLWKHDLLVGSLKQRTLFRLQMHGDRVVYSEPIELGHRIRDLTETPNGEIFIWSDDQNLLRLRPRNSLPGKNETLAQAGERLFFKCVGCHGIQPNSPQGIGPNLHKVYNRRIAALGGYDYSPALRGKTPQRWTRENLDLFLKDPGIFAPGSKMYMKVPDEDERRALVHYLENN